MAATLITYDLNREVTDRERSELRKAIKGLGSWVKLSESSYATDSELTPTQIYQELEEFIDSNDKIYIITLCKPYDSDGAIEDELWLDEKLT